MTESKKLHWMAWEPTPYNDVLFCAIALDPAIDLLVHYRNDKLDLHPWKTEFRNGYKSRIYGNSSNPFHIDRTLFRLVFTEPESLYLLTGWPGLMGKLMLVLLSAFKRSFLFWTDTPQLRKQIKSNKHLSIVECREAKPYPLWHRILRNILYSIVFKNAYQVLSTGKPGIEALELLGCPKEKLVCFPFVVSHKAEIQNNSKNKHPIVFVSAGQLVWKKGYDVAIRALELASRKCECDYKYYILGEGASRYELEALIKEHSLEDCVFLPGWAEPDELTVYYRDAHAFLHPARIDPFPVAVLEAMASGLAILGSDVSGSVNDRVKNGINGYVHQVEDVDALAEHILHILQNPIVAESMGNAARKTAERWPAQRNVEILKKAIGIPQ